jgi:gliding motility-associated-like protein
MPPSAVSCLIPENNLMKFFVFLFGLFFQVSLSGQNLIPNPSFEKLSSCPDNFYQIAKAPPWFSPDCVNATYVDHGYAVLFNACHTSFASVPANVVCTQPARTGLGYAGITVFSADKLGYRPYLETPLTTSLQTGKKYYFSMYFNICNRYTGLPICFVPDSLGAVFTGSAINENINCRPLPLVPDIHARLPQITPGPEWHKVEGCFTAKGGEKYITIGNFAGEQFSTCGPIDSLPIFMFVDDVSLIPEVSKAIDTTLCADASWNLDATTLRDEYKSMDGWSYRWSDGDTSSTRVFNKAVNETLTVSKAGCFNDVYQFNIRTEPSCACQVFAPTAFTPNNDGLNDLFLPQMKCGAIEISNYSLSVYNRWGQRIFYSTDRTKGWDGKYKGILAGNEVFVWMVQYDKKDGPGNTRKSVSGTITTIR